MKKGKVVQISKVLSSSDGVAINAELDAICKELETESDDIPRLLMLIERLTQLDAAMLKSERIFAALNARAEYLADLIQSYTDEGNELMVAQALQEVQNIINALPPRDEKWRSAD